MRGHHNDITSEKAPSDDGAEFKGMHQLPTVDALSKQQQGEEPSHDDLHRALTSRQISMIAIGGAVGTGLIISSGSALHQAGPAGLLIAYIVLGMCCYCVLTALGEMTAYMPLKRGFAGHASQFVDPAFGFFVGWNYLFKYLILPPSQLNATSVLITYWRPDLSGAIWISIFGAAIVSLNVFGGVRVFGAVEYWMSFLKILVLVGLLILCICINAGAGPNNNYRGFSAWGGGRAFNEYLEPGAKGRFIGTWSAFTIALFAYIGSELVGVTAGEAKNPRKTLPRAIKSLFYRILFFYILLIFLVGLIVNSDDPLLVGASKGKATAAASPFVVAIKSAGIPVLPSFLNACFLIFTFSAANSDLYIASRTLYGLARAGQAPRFFTKCDKNGTPWVAILGCSLFIGLAYINVADGGPKAFGYLTSAVTIFGGLAWIGILVSHIRMMAGMRAQGIDRNTLPYKSPFQPYFDYVALFIVCLVVTFKSFTSFIHTFDYKSFITGYIGLPVGVCLFLGWKLTTRSKFIRATEMDLSTGTRELADADDDDSVGDEEKLSAKQRVVNFVKRV